MLNKQRGSKRSEMERKKERKKELFEMTLLLIDGIYIQNYALTLFDFYI